MERGVVIDTDFLSSFFKINRIDLIFKSFDAKRIFITKSVLYELQEAHFYEEFFKLLESKDNKIIVEDVEKIIYSKEFGDGELESISLAKKTNSVLLMSDKPASKLAENIGVVVLNIPEFLVDCKKRNIISKIEIEQIIKDLKEKDYYEFAKEVEDKLLE